MSDALYCVTCGMPQYAAGQLAACKQCGSKAFTSSLQLVQWEIALTWNDKQFLRSVRISPA